MLIRHNSTQTLQKYNFAMTYLTGVAQDWFEVGLNQEDQGILQDWLSDWNLFVDKLRRHFGLSDPIGKAANMLDNLRMKPGDKNFHLQCGLYVLCLPIRLEE